MEILPFHRKAVRWINDWAEPNSSIIRSDRDLSPLAKINEKGGSDMDFVKDEPLESKLKTG